MKTALFRAKAREAIAKWRAYDGLDEVGEDVTTFEVQSLGTGAACSLGDSFEQRRPIWGLHTRLKTVIVITKSQPLQPREVPLPSFRRRETSPYVREPYVF